MPTSIRMHSETNARLARQLRFEYLEDRRLLAIDLVSFADNNLVNGSDTPQVASAISELSVSDDGRYVVYESSAANIVLGDANNANDIFLHDLVLDTTTLVSKNAAGTGTGNSHSFDAQISGDGSKVVFLSQATDLVAGIVDNNADGTDAFVFDVATGNTSLVSESTTPNQTANDYTDMVSISGNGSKVVFRSIATNLIAGVTDSNGFDLFLRDTIAGTTTIVSKSSAGNQTANGFSGDARISSDGSKVVFVSGATNLVSGITDIGNTLGGRDVFLYDVATGTNVLVSQSVAGNKTANDGSGRARIAGDGSKVMFVSDATDLVSGISDGNGTWDTFLYDVASDSISLVSESTTPNKTGNNSSGSYASNAFADISRDGTNVVFRSLATDLVAGTTDTNNASDVFLYDIASDTITLVSGSATANQTGNDGSPGFDNVSISGDGSHIVFRSRATDLISGINDVNGAQDDVFLYDAVNQRLSLVSNSTTANQTANSGSFFYDTVAISNDGSTVVFNHLGTDLVGDAVDVNSAIDVFRFDVGSSEPALVSQRGVNLEKAIAGNSASLPTFTGPVEAASQAGEQSISDDGRFVAYSSWSSDLVPGDVNNQSDIFLHDLLLRTTTLISSNADGTGTANGSSSAPQISGDSSKVLFSSRATNLVSGVTDLNESDDLFLYDVASGSITLVSENTIESRTGNNITNYARISRDGSKILFLSYATDLLPGVADNNDELDVFLYDVASRTTLLVSESTIENQTGDDGASSTVVANSLSISDDGSKVVFRSNASNLVEGIADLNETSDVFLYDTINSSTLLVSQSVVAAQSANGFSGRAVRISGDGTKIAYFSEATDLADGVIDLNETADVFIYDVETESNTLVSESTTPHLTGNGGNSSFSSSLSISDDGLLLVFSSTATDLVEGVTDNNGVSLSGDDIFLYDVPLSRLTLVSESTTANQTANNESSNAVISRDGTTILFDSFADDLASGVTDNNGATDVFRYDVHSGTTILVSESITEGQTGNYTFGSYGIRLGSNVASISSDGAVAVFTSFSSNLTQDTFDANGANDVFVLRVNVDDPSADFDGDHDVDGNDFLAWQRGFGLTDVTLAEGDANGDGEVDGTDLGFWQTQYGLTAPLANSLIDDATRQSAVAPAWILFNEEPDIGGNLYLELQAARDQVLVPSNSFSMLSITGAQNSAPQTISIESDDSQERVKPWLAERLLERVFDLW